MESQMVSTIAWVSSTGLFVGLLGFLLIVSRRATKKSEKIEQELDNEIPKVAAAIQRRHEKRHGRPDTKLNLIINESFSAASKQR